MRRLTGWIVAGILAAVVEFWWGPLRWVLYAAPGYVPDGQRTNDFDLAGLGLDRDICRDLVFRALAGCGFCRQRHLRFIGRRCGFSSPTVVIY